MSAFFYQKARSVWLILITFYIVRPCKKFPEIMSLSPCLFFPVCLVSTPNPLDRFSFKIGMYGYYKRCHTTSIFSHIGFNKVTLIF